MWGVGCYNCGGRYRPCSSATHNYCPIVDGLVVAVADDAASITLGVSSGMMTMTTRMPFLNNQQQVPSYVLVVVSIGADTAILLFFIGCLSGGQCSSRGRINNDDKRRRRQYESVGIRNSN